MGRLRRVICLLVGVSAAFIGPTAARASTVELVYDHADSGPHNARYPVFALHYAGAPGETNDVTYSYVDGFQGVRVEDAGAPLSAGVNCRADGAGVLCQTAAPSSHIGTAVFDLGDGNDRFTARTPPYSFTSATVHGGPGSDELTAETGTTAAFDGGPGADRIRAASPGSSVTYADRTVGVSVTPDGQPNDGEPGEGDDVVGPTAIIGGSGDDDLVAGDQFGRLAGNAGNDRLVASDSTSPGYPGIPRGGGEQMLGGTGNDILVGLRGNDELIGGPGADDLHGGGGTDSTSYLDPGSADAPVVTVTLDDRPGDGVAGENDNVHSDVEVVEGGKGPATLIGNASDNQLTSYGGGSVLLGRGGADFLTSFGTSLGFGPATVLDGGAGPDRIYTTGTRDRVRMRDGEVDQLTCDGFGPASVVADPTDAFVAAFAPCDLVLPFGSGRLLRMSRRGSIPVRLTCTARSTSCRAKVTVRLAAPRLARLRLGFAVRTITRGRTVRVAVLTSASVRRVVTRRRQLRVEILATIDHGLGRATTTVSDGELLAPGR